MARFRLYYFPKENRIKTIHTSYKVNNKEINGLQCINSSMFWRFSVKDLKRHLKRQKAIFLGYV